MQGMLLHYTGLYNEEIWYCLSVNSTIIHIIALSTKKRLDDQLIVNQLRLGARDYFFPKFAHPFSSSLYWNIRHLCVHFTCNIATCLNLFLLRDSMVFERHQP